MAFILFYSFPPALLAAGFGALSALLPLPFFPSCVCLPVPEMLMTRNVLCSGFCSREQIYRPEECGICHSTLVGKKGGGFWEGGKGTRDKVKMSRKGEYGGLVLAEWGLR